MNKLRVGNRSVGLPASRIARIAIGSILIVFGFLGFLPVLGFWMVPVGVAVLAVDVPVVRRANRRFSVWLGRKVKHRWPRLWAWFH